MSLQKRRVSDIVRELHAEAHRDGYYGRKTNLTTIVDELTEELTYTGTIAERAVQFEQDFNLHCALPGQNDGGSTQ